MLFLIRRSAAIARARDVASGDDDVAGDVEYQPLFGNDRTRPVYAGAIAPAARQIANRSRCSSFTSNARHSPGRARRRRRQSAGAPGQLQFPGDCGFRPPGLAGRAHVPFARRLVQRFYHNRSGSLVAFHARPGMRPTRARLVRGHCRRDWLEFVCV
jgi:hypothetical protein